MKTLICAGDSYTDRYRTTNNFDKVWPNFLAEKTKPKHLINIGSSGAGNYEIFSRTVDEITLNKNIDLVVVMWSEFPRIDFELDMRTNPWPPLSKTGRPDPYTAKRFKRGKNKFPQNYMNLHPEREIFWTPNSGRIVIENNKQKIIKGWKNRIGFDMITNYLTNYYADINKFLRYVYSIQSICELEHIPYIQIMGPEPVMGPVDSEGNPIWNWRKSHYQASDGRWYKNHTGDTGRYQSVLTHVTDHFMFDKITKNFIGWPIFLELDGYHIDDFLSSKDSKWDKTRGSRWPSELRISEDDSHPNEKGHELIGELLYNEYKKIYPKD